MPICPNGCYPLSLELWQMENEITGECKHEWEQDWDGAFCKLCGEPHPNNIPEWDTDSLQDSRPDLFNPNGTRKEDY